LSKCNLDTHEPNLTVMGTVSEANLQGGLTQLKEKIAKEHKISGWFPHPMPGFPEYQGKVWEWDFKPTGERSSTRGGWRLLAFVPEPKGPEPILARPFICWDKGEAPKGNQEFFISKALKKFLSQHIVITSEEEVFRHTVDGQGKNIALCQLCWERLESSDLQELEILKDTHRPECVGHPPA
jgi:hypothetical protein